MKVASELSRLERNNLCSEYEQQLQGPMQQQELAINLARNYFSTIPESERTPELSALEELFSDVAEGSLREDLLLDLEVLRDESASPERQDALWFEFQHIAYVQSCRLGLYYPLAQEMAVRFGFQLTSDAVAAA